jgi:predicted RNA-binding Zn-ribbon protein involved in translation (DUF1610 family)
MPVWICPSCHGSTKVALAHLATMQPCPKCGTVGRVVQSTSKPAPAAPPVTPASVSQSIPSDSLPVPLSVINSIVADSPLLIRLYRGVSLFGSLAVILVTVLAVAQMPNPPLMVLLPIPAALLWLAMVWLVTDFMSDVYRCRRLLEEIAKK